MATVLLATLLAAAAAGAASPTAGRRLAEALRELQAEGLRVVFTDQVVEAQMRVVREPSSETERQKLDELLAPWDLTVRTTSDGTLVVVPAEQGARTPGRLWGSVRAGLSGRGIAGAAIRVRSRSDGDDAAPEDRTGLELRSGADGRFELTGIPDGGYVVSAVASGFLPATAESVAVPARGSVEVPLLLFEEPMVEEELLIRPSRVQLTWEEPSSPVAVGRRDIEALPQLGNDVFRAMSLVPGVSGNDITARFWIRGGRRDEVKIELDGQELYEAFHLKDYDDALSVVSADTLAGLTLSNGGYPVSDGDRMSGVLDMRTRIPDGPLHASFSASLLAFTAAGSGLLPDGRGDWLAQGRLGSIDLASRLFDQEDPSYADLFARVSLRAGQRHTLRGNVLLADDRLSFHEVNDEGFKDRDTEYDSASAWLTHQATIGSSTLVQTRLAWSEFARSRDGAEVEEEGGFVVFDSRRTVVPEIEQTWTLFGPRSLTLDFGVEGRFYESDFDYLNESERTAGLPVEFPPDWPVTPTGSFTRFLGEPEGDHYGAWGSARSTFFGSLSAELGLRWDRHTLTDDTLLSPRANLAWRFAGTSVLRAAWGHFHQSQRTYELAVQDGEDRYAPAERSEHWLLGYEWLRRESAAASSVTGLRAELYHREIPNPRPRFENLFEAFNLYPEVEPDRVQVAPERSTTSGVELSLNGRLAERVQWRLGYGWARVEDRLDGVWYRRQVDQPHIVSAIVGLPIGQRWRVDLAWRYHTGWPTTPVSLGFTSPGSDLGEDGDEGDGDDGELEPFLVLGPYNAARLEAYHRLDLRLSRQWTVGRGVLQLFVDVQNLYGRGNVAGYDYSYDDESEELDAEPETWPGIVPSLGLKWSF